MEEHGQVIGGLREAVASLDQHVQGLDHRVGRREERVDQRFDALDMKMSRQFHWLAGILMSGMIAVIGALIAVVVRR